MEEQRFKYLIAQQKKRDIILTKMPVGLLVDISFVAIRGRNSEKGAVQRVLNQRRIHTIKHFTLSGGDYPSAIVLNWINPENPLNKKNDSITFFNIRGTAQIIDGQHRIAGIKAAIDENPHIAELEIPVAIYEDLSTEECAEIFLSINTEQKPAPRSLVFDLYGIASREIVDPAALRASDIAMSLNSMEESPYYNNIKFPGSPKRKGGIALSTAVSAIKPLVEEKGDFEQIGFKELESQKQAILNFFIALENKYHNQWDKKDNAFQYASGFIGAIDFLKLKVIPYCNSKKSFTVKTVEDILNFDYDGLIYQEEVKGLGGKEASKRVYDRLVNAFVPEQTEPVEWEL